MIRLYVYDKLGAIGTRAMNGEQREQEDFVHCFVPIREIELMLQEAEHFMKKQLYLL